MRLFATTKWIPEIQAAAARLLDASDEPSAVILMDLLESDAASLRRAAIEALGDTGALEAVETLLRMTGENALARTAIAKIQQREGGDRGALSVAVENLRVGALSVDEGPGAGALSPAETTELPVARRPRGQKT